MSPDLNRVDLQPLIDALLECSTMGNVQGRGNVLEQMPGGMLRSDIPRAPCGREDVTAIVRTCAQYPGGLSELVDALHKTEGDLLSIRAVEHELEKLYAALQANTDGGAVIFGSVHIKNGNFVGRDQIKIYLDTDLISPENEVAQLAAYRARVLASTEYVSLRGIPLPQDRSGGRKSLNIPLDKVYIRLQAVEYEQKRHREEEERRTQEGMVTQEDVTHRGDQRDMLI